MPKSVAVTMSSCRDKEFLQIKFLIPTRPDMLEIARELHGNVAKASRNRREAVAGGIARISLAA